MFGSNLEPGSKCCLSLGITVSHTEWLCFCRLEREEEYHLLAGRCEVYGDIREKYGELEDDEDLVQFFQEVLERRGELEKESRDARGLDGQDQDS